MKIYKHDYLFYIRLTIKRRGDKNLYLPLIETTLEETEKVLSEAIRGANIDPLSKVNTTTIEMREATGGKNGAYKQLSFKGLSPLETLNTITNYINSLQDKNPIKKITVAYWHGTKFKDIPYNHNESREYSIKERNSIIEQVLKSGYSVMLRPLESELIIWIDNGRFGQK